MFSTFILLNRLAIVPVLSSAASIPFPLAHIFFAISFNVITIIYFKTLIPGKSFPSRYSKNAPPAVDKCEKESLSLLLFIAARVSPPPRTDIKDLFIVFLEIISAIDKVPFEKFSFSKYPAGPFHKTVFDLFITFFEYF